MVRVITVKPKDMSDETIKARLDSLKQEIKDNESEIKELEDELERRKQEVPLGVPVEHRSYIEAYFVNCTGDVINQPLDVNDSYDKKIFDMLDVFNSEVSAEKHKEMLLDWRKALVANSKGEPIDIKVLLPLLRKGRVAYCPISRNWFWTNEIPQLLEETWGTLGDLCWIKGFNVKPPEDWRESLMECGL